MFHDRRRIRNQHRTSPQRDDRKNPGPGIGDRKPYCVAGDAVDRRVRGGGWRGAMIPFIRKTTAFRFVPKFRPNAEAIEPRASGVAVKVGPLPIPFSLRITVCAKAPAWSGSALRTIRGMAVVLPFNRTVARRPYPLGSRLTGRLRFSAPTVVGSNGDAKGFERLRRRGGRCRQATGTQMRRGKQFGSPRHTKYVQVSWRVGGRAISPLLTKGLCEVLRRSRPATPCRHQTGSKGKVQQGIGKLGKRGGRGAPQLEIWRAALAA